MRNLEDILKQPQHKITLSNNRFEQIKTILVFFISVFFVSSLFYTPIGFVAATGILLLTIIENFSTPLKLLGVGVEPEEYDVDSLYYQLNTTYHQTAKELVKEAIERSFHRASIPQVLDNFQQHFSATASAWPPTP